MGTRLFTRGGLAMACAGLLALSLTLRLLCVAQPVGAALQNALTRLAALRERIGICETEGAAAMQSEAPVTAAGFEAEPATEASGIEHEASMAAAGSGAGLSAGNENPGAGQAGSGLENAASAEAAVPALAGPAPMQPAAPAQSPGPQFSPAEAEAISISGSCSYAVDKAGLLQAPLPFALSDRAAVLIVHTHTTEAYTPAEGAEYAETGAYHTRDETRNMLAVGDALEAALNALGVPVIHDRTVHDEPDYNASYANAKRTIEADLAENDAIVLVLDLHRDAAEPPVREALELDGQACAKLMLVVGTDEGGLYHPFWQENLSCALKLQALLQRSAPGLCRPLNLRRERFNGQASPGAFIVEVGSTGNTLEEAKRSMPYLADAVAKLLGK